MSESSHPLFLVGVQLSVGMVSFARWHTNHFEKHSTNRIYSCSITLTFLILNRLFVCLFALSIIPDILFRAARIGIPEDLSLRPVCTNVDLRCTDRPPFYSTSTFLSKLDHSMYVLQRWPVWLCRNKMERFVMCKTPVYSVRCLAAKPIPTVLVCACPHPLIHRISSREWLPTSSTDVAPPSWSTESLLAYVNWTIFYE